MRGKTHGWQELFLRICREAEEGIRDEESDYCGRPGCPRWRSVAPVYDFKTETTAGELPTQTSRAGFTRTVALDQVAVWDGLGSPNNVVMTIDMAALFGLASGSAIDLNGIGWDVTVSTFGASWLSEATMYFDNQTQDSGAGIFLSVGAGSDVAGTANFTSGGIMDGSITLQSSVPAPSGVALLGLGGLVAARRRR